MYVYVNMLTFCLTKLKQPQGCGLCTGRCVSTWNIHFTCDSWKREHVKSVESIQQLGTWHVFEKIRHRRIVDLKM
jgi:hypothetical protein